MINRRSHQFGLVLLLYPIVLWSNLSAGKSPAGYYQGFDSDTSGITERLFIVEVINKAAANLFLFDYVLDRVEFATVSLSDGSGTGTTSEGRGVSIQSFMNQSPVELTLAGERRTLEFLGPSTAGSQRSFSGTIFPTGANGSWASRISYFWEDRIFMFWISDTGFMNGGGGTVENGQAKVAVVTGQFIEFPFIEVENAARTGRATFQGSTLSAFDFVMVESQAASMVNISTRGWIGGGQNMIVGTVISDGPKRLLIRAVGPTLAEFGVSTAHPNPKITLFEGQNVIESNDDWSGKNIVDAAAYVGAFALAESSADASLLVTLEEGAYTIVVEGANDPGEAIVEVYEVR